MGYVTSYKRETYSPVIDTNSVEFKRRSLTQVGQLRYGRRGDRNYYAMIALWDDDLLSVHNKEHLSVKGYAYNEVIERLYDIVFK